MRLVSFIAVEDMAAAPRTGVVVDDGVIDCTDLASDGIRHWLRPETADSLRRAADDRAPRWGLDSVRLLPPISDPAKIVCVGLNYRSHLRETARPPPEHPTLFPRYADSQMGHGAPAVIPSESTQLDYEGELAVVIGRSAYRVSVEKAWDVVGGYAAYDDFTVRDWQRHTSQFMPGKNFPSTGGFGPWLVTPDDVPDIDSCVLTTRVNGEVRQRASISDLMFNIPELVACISTFTPLAPGDLGDQVSVEISGIGTHKPSHYSHLKQVEPAGRTFSTRRNSAS
jgi:2-keto-4-pentenoate hydratase/2-oxohepta-3-ene-1,7-dioic acid hydratase in catechol pathway